MNKRVFVFIFCVLMITAFFSGCNLNTDLSTTGMDNEFAAIDNGIPRGVSGYAILYTNKNYEGNTISVIDNCSDLAIGSISSVKLIGLNRIKLFDGDNYKGKSIYLTTSAPNLSDYKFNNECDSIQIFPCDVTVKYCNSNGSYLSQYFSRFAGEEIHDVLTVPSFTVSPNTLPRYFREWRVSYGSATLYTPTTSNLAARIDGVTSVEIMAWY
ncbi:MAG: hypothetical protein JXB88_03580 [Spirochaetales bacterium]|nr:hypothetical protein [Spirochaetales bacterium]